ncbi:AraC family transcriptional regulator [Allopontixanthobacter sp.]|uniref:AraC family transcriptional regulator n=1 Tax=Allopontixanthobacter sp. TaxID=2906452 RepID=UPI002AB831F9|nr:AraC family transcriptional regulator [Allopontixanthobacter sp.]MDZ4307712.1 AraC family transcriptional regulator [Allopontixanthobacter sp.]
MKAELIEKMLCLLDVRLHALALCEVNPGVRLRIPPMDNVLVHYILRGRGLLQVGDAPALPVRRGMIVFMPQKIEHDLFTPDSDKCEPTVWQDSAESYGDGFMRIATDTADEALVTACGNIDADCEGIDLFERFREPVAEDLSESRVIRAAFESMNAELEQPRFGTRPLAEAIMKQCLVLAIRQQMERGELSLVALIGAVDPRLTRALLAILEDPARDHSLEELARRSGMSRSLFAERFSETFHRPPMDLVRQVRLHRAANLLRATRLPVQIVALSVGYASRSYFSRAFRAAYGDDPRSFRDSSRKPAIQNEAQMPIIQPIER